MKRAVGVDDGAVVLRQVAGVRGRPHDRAVGHRVVGADQPAAGERELVVGEAEGGVDRQRAAQVALRARQVPAIEPVHAGEVGAVGLERLAGGPREADRQLGRRAREIEQLGRQLVEQRPGVRRRSGRPPARRLIRVAAGDVVDPGRQVERVAGRAKSPSTTVHTPASRASRRAMSRPMSSPGSSSWRPSRSCSRSWSTTVRSFHCDRLSPSMLTLPSRIQSTARSSRRLSNGSTRIECRGLTPAGGPVAPAGQADGRAQRGERDRRRPATTAVRRSARRRQRPLAHHRLAQLLAGLPALGRLLLQRPHHRAGQRPRAVGPDPLDRRRALGDVLGDHHPVGALERRMAREHLVGDDAERVEIAPAVHLLAGRLLRAHVARRADRDALPGAGGARPPPSPGRCRSRPAARGRCRSRAARSPASRPGAPRRRGRRRRAPRRGRPRSARPRRRAAVPSRLSRWRRLSPSTSSIT